jgi:hypothetical protein
MARLMAASTRSFGMPTLLAFWKHLRKAAFDPGSGPPAFTAIAISFPIRVNCFAIRSHLANIEALRTSNILPICIYNISPAKIRIALKRKPPQIEAVSFFII